jgi:hypothetical protein
MTQGLPPPYPLLWPEGRGRVPSHRREKGRYSLATVAQAMNYLDAETNRWRSYKRADGLARLTGWELTANYSGRGRDPDDPGAALWFTLSTGDATIGQSLMVLACDKFDRLPQNIRAISLTMERLRLVDEIGAYSLINAVEGAKALPPPSPARPWHEVLGVREDASLPVVTAAFRALIKESASDQVTMELKAALDAARENRHAVG